MYRNHYITTLFLSLLFVHIPTLCMIIAEKFTCFPQLLPETKSLVIDRVDNMLPISLANKECYTMVQKKQIDHIIYMHDKQDPSFAQFNIPPFIFTIPFNTKNDFGGKHALSPHSRMFYKSTTREQYFTHDDDNYKHFHSTITWRDPYEYIWPTNLLINIFKQNINSIKDLLAKHYKLILEKNGADK